MSLPASTRLGGVTLTVADLDAMTSFYERAIGLRTLERDEHGARLGATDGAPLVELVGDPDAPAATRRATGLFHQAFLVPDRAELARSLQRVADAGWRFTGFSDHLVSEALYLDDPEGNGIEIYRDRPRDEWKHTPTGEIEMATIPLDAEGVMAAMPDDADTGASPRTIVGHVHLRVADIEPGEAFYAGLIGFDVTVRSYPGALFVSAGGYHHHVGMNTWGSAGAPAPPDGARGLRRYEVVLDGAAQLAAVRSRLEAGGIDGAAEDGGLLVRDPSGNAALLHA
jgi:catechol 2,3-dioxygenase